MKKTPVQEFIAHYNLDALLEEEDAIELLDTDITVGRLTKRKGWNKRRAQGVIDGWVAAGKVESLGKRREPVRGAMVDAWRLK